MNIYIWKRVENCTSAWHSEGGVIVFAESLDEARSLANTYSDPDPDNVDGEERIPRIADDEQPDIIRECVDGPKLVILFPDAGCC